MSLKNTYFRLGMFLVASWLFVAVSFFVSERSTVDWFSRSGAVMCLMAAVANFTLLKTHQSDLARIFRDHERSAHEKAEAILNPPKPYVLITHFSYVTGVLGTAVWGYGDLLL